MATGASARHKSAKIRNARVDGGVEIVRDMGVVYHRPSQLALKEQRLRKVPGAGLTNVVYGTLSNLSIGLARCGVKLLGESLSGPRFEISDLKRDRGTDRPA